MKRVKAAGVAVAIIATFGIAWWLAGPTSSPLVPITDTQPGLSETTTKKSASEHDSAAPVSLTVRASARTSETFASAAISRPSSENRVKPSDAGTTDTQIQKRAEAFIEKLRQPAERALSATQADHFVAPGQSIDLESKRVVEEVTLKELRRDKNLAAGTPLTLVKQVSQIELTSPEKLIADAGGDLEKSIRILSGGKIRVVSVREALAAQADTETGISVVKKIDYLEPTTLAELLKRDPNEENRRWDDMLRVIRGQYRPEVARVSDLLAGVEKLKKESVVYIHSVRAEDTQGVWGIIHHGLIQNFAQGMAIRRGQELDTYQVHIPRNADERQKDNSSSFLGQLIDSKARNSVVYNFRIGRMTRDPGHIIPGNEIVIINFSPEELVSIYKHFLNLKSHAS